MDDFDDNPLDILDDDGDDALEMALLFDKDDKGGNKPQGSHTGCSFILLAAAWGVVKLVA